MFQNPSLKNLLNEILSLSSASTHHETIVEEALFDLRGQLTGSKKNSSRDGKQKSKKEDILKDAKLDQKYANLINIKSLDKIYEEFFSSGTMIDQIDGKNAAFKDLYANY